MALVGRFVIQVGHLHGVYASQKIPGFIAEPVTVAAEEARLHDVLLHRCAVWEESVTNVKSDAFRCGVKGCAFEVRGRNEAWCHLRGSFGLREEGRSLRKPYVPALPEDCPLKSKRRPPRERVQHSVKCYRLDIGNDTIITLERIGFMTGVINRLGGDGIGKKFSFQECFMLVFCS